MSEKRIQLQGASAFAHVHGLCTALHICRVLFSVHRCQEEMQLMICRYTEIGSELYAD